MLCHSANTRRVYDSNYRLFVEWCEEQGRWVDVAPAYPHDAVLEYLAVKAERGYAASTLTQIVFALRCRFKDAGLPDPTRHELVDRALRGARRLLGKTAARRPD